MEYGTLILVHVLSAVVWGGGVIFMGFYLVPSVLEAGPAGGAVMGGIMKRKMPVLMSAAGFGALLSGLWLYYLRARQAPGWGGTPEGMVLSLGGLLGISALGIGMFRQRPLALKMAQLAAEGRGAEIPPVAQALGKTAKVVAWHAVAVVVLMAGHRLASQFTLPAAEAPAAAAPATAPH